jgi:aspartyl protease family protein
MRSFLVFAAVIAAVAMFGARQAERVAATRAPASAAMVAAPEPEPAPSGGDVVLSADRQGHFHAQARVDGRHLEFLVDTGATMVALTARSAAALGIHPGVSEFTVTVSTANGSVRAAPVQLNMIEVDDIVVRDVPALVFADGILNENLLGTSFLSRLRRYEYGRGKLVLER